MVRELRGIPLRQADVLIPDRILNPRANNAAPIVITAFEPERHAERYLALLENAGIASPDRDKLERYFNTIPSTIFVAEAVDKKARTCSPVGFITGSGTPRELQGLVVDKAYRGGVIGSNLVAAEIYAAAEEGLTRVEALVDNTPENLNEIVRSLPLPRWYASQGFKAEYAAIGMVVETQDYTKNPRDYAISQAFRDVFVHTSIPQISDQESSTAILTMNDLICSSDISPVRDEPPSFSPVFATPWHSIDEITQRRWVNTGRQSNHLEWLLIHDSFCFIY